MQRAHTRRLCTLVIAVSQRQSHPRLYGTSGRRRVNCRQGHPESDVNAVGQGQLCIGHDRREGIGDRLTPDEQPSTDLLSALYL